MDAHRFKSLFIWALVIGDIVMAALAFFLAHRLRVYLPWPTPAMAIEPVRNYWPIVALYVSSVVGIFFIMRRYHPVRAASRVDEFYATFGGVFLAMLLTIALAVLFFKNSVFEINLPRAMLIYAWLIGVLLITLNRWALQLIRAILRRRGIIRDKVLIIGGGETARLVLQKMNSSPFLGYAVVGFVEDIDADASAGTLPPGCRRLGNIADLPRLVDEYAVDEVIIAKPEVDDEEMVRLISLCHRDRVSIKVVPDVFELMAAGVTIDDLGGLPLLNIRDVALRGWKLAFKRAMDIVGSAVALILSSPMMLFLAVLIKLESPGPVFYVQERMGLDAKPFPIIKFRSMRQDAEADGPGWTVKDDPRRTRVGSFIRRFSLDEWPNFINVLLGDMSLVGPRPEQPAFVEQFRRLVPRYMERHREKAGITGWAQVNGLRGDTSIIERTKYDLWYIENWSIWLDIKIIIRTIFRFLIDRNAY